MWPFNKNKKDSKDHGRPSYISIPETSKEIEIERMSRRLKDVLYTTNAEIVVLCIGSDRSTGDSLGPLVGTKLKERKVSLPVYGTLEEPVHALNLKKVLKEIRKNHKNPFILGIDACLGDESQIGMVFFREGPFTPGNAISKSLPSIGDYHMKAIVNHLNPFAPVQSLNTTRLYIVKKLAEIIVEIIVRALKEERCEL
jgi:putative sporulation protein YyaC